MAQDSVLILSPKHDDSEEDFDKNGFHFACQRQCDPIVPSVGTTVTIIVIDNIFAYNNIVYIMEM